MMTAVAARCPLHRSRRQAGCPDCQRYSRSHRAARRTGALPGMQPVLHARAHVHGLLAAGMGALRICAVSGLSAPSLRRIVSVWSDDYMIRAATQDALMAVALPSELRHLRVRSHGFLRRMDAMQLRGWSVEALAEAVVGHDTRMNAVAWRARTTGHVSGALAASMAAVYTLTYGQAPQVVCPQSVGKARARRAYPDAAWTPGTIDMPKARPACPPAGGADDMPDGQQ